MMRRVILRAKAREEIREAARWYEQEVAGLGEDFATELRSILIRLAENPLQFPCVGLDTRRACLQRFPYFVYFLLAAESTVVVFAVLHHRRRPGLWRAQVR